MGAMGKCRRVRGDRAVARAPPPNDGGDGPRRGPTPIHRPARDARAGATTAMGGLTRRGVGGGSPTRSARDRESPRRPGMGRRPHEAGTAAGRGRPRSRRVAAASESGRPGRPGPPNTGARCNDRGGPPERRGSAPNRRESARRDKTLRRGGWGGRRPGRCTPPSRERARADQAPAVRAAPGRESMQVVCRLSDSSRLSYVVIGGRTRVGNAAPTPIVADFPLARLQQSNTLAQNSPGQSSSKSKCGQPWSASLASIPGARRRSRA